MALITDYATLQTEIASLLNRGDLESAIPGFIQDLEAWLKDDPRARKLTTRSPFSVGADGVNLPADFQEMDAIYHDGPVYYEPVHMVTPEQIPHLKLDHGITGPPAFAAVFEGDPMTLSFAPAPDDTYELKMTYFRTITSLSDASTTNWLLLERPDIYKFGACITAAPHLKHDERLATWEAIYNQRLDELSSATERKRFGRANRRQVRPFGG